MKERDAEGQQLQLSDFLRLDLKEIERIVLEKERPKCVAVMLDGTRRVLKLEPGFHDDRWLYHEDHITGLIVE